MDKAKLKDKLTKRISILERAAKSPHDGTTESRLYAVRWEAQAEELRWVLEQLKKE